MGEQFSITAPLLQLHGQWMTLTNRANMKWWESNGELSSHSTALTTYIRIYLKFCHKDNRGISLIWSKSHEVWGYLIENYSGKKSLYRKVNNKIHYFVIIPSVGRFRDIHIFQSKRDSLKLLDRGGCISSET